eukprot:4783144-Prymnesium_polylepis.1
MDWSKQQERRNNLTILRGGARRRGGVMLRSAKGLFNAQSTVEIKSRLLVLGCTETMAYMYGLWCAVRRYSSATRLCG